MRNKFLQLILVSLDSASWELHQYSRRMCGPMKNPKVETRSRDSNLGPHDCKADALPHDHGHHTCPAWDSTAQDMGSGFVFANHFLERSLSDSPDFSRFRGISMQHNFRLAKPYGLANQKLCYISICISELFYSTEKPMQVNMARVSYMARF